jgi:CRP/FNR family cyclic AMP-dependent transcriptional regulator
MIRARGDQAALSEKFMAALLVRNIRSRGRSLGSPFQSQRETAGCVLLKLARMREHNVMPDAKMPVFSHETVAEMVGTTRSRITYFTNKFRTMGLIDYDSDGFTVRTELLTDVVLHD